MLLSFMVLILSWLLPFVNNLKVGGGVFFITIWQNRATLGGGHTAHLLPSDCCRHSDVGSAAALSLNKYLFTNINSATADA